MGSTKYLPQIVSEFRNAEVVVVDENAVQRLAVYCEQLEHWNRKVNLTALEGTALVRRLLVEPIWIAQKLDIKGRVCDIGSGNGSPAIPMRLA